MELDYNPNVFIRLFRVGDPYAANLSGTKFAYPMELPRTETDYDKVYRAMGFSEEAIKSRKIRLSYGNAWHYFNSCGEEEREIETDKMKYFDYDVQTECFAIKWKHCGTAVKSIYTWIMIACFYIYRTSTNIITFRSVTRYWQEPKFHF